MNVDKLSNLYRSSVYVKDHCDNNISNMLGKVWEFIDEGKWNAQTEGAL